VCRTRRCKRGPARGHGKTRLGSLGGVSCGRVLRGCSCRRPRGGFGMLHVWLRRALFWRGWQLIKGAQAVGPPGSMGWMRGGSSGSDLHRDISTVCPEVFSGEGGGLLGAGTWLSPLCRRAFQRVCGARGQLDVRTVHIAIGSRFISNLSTFRRIYRSCCYK
jgi:hypothetical protein